MPIPPGMHRVTVDLPNANHEAMQEAYLADGLAVPARLRALAALWQQDPELAERTTALGLQMRAEARKRAVASRLATMKARKQEDRVRQIDGEDDLDP